MAKFTRYNNPNKRKYRRKMYSDEYVNERRNELYMSLATATTESDKQILLDAFRASINP